MTDNDMTSDILIYNILNQSTDEFISKCNVKFIDRSVPAEEDDTIYIANVDLETLRETFNSVEYKALVNIYVKTKNTDYINGSRSLRTTVKHIKNVLRNNVDCKQRHITFRNTTYEYGSEYTLKGLHLLVQMVEYEDLRVPDEGESCINIDEVDVDVK
jgi:hypothetical protein